MSHAESPISPIHLPLGKSVLAVELYDLVANKRLFTFHREGSQCTFSEDIKHKEFVLTLRLDWGDLREGDPTLDLDVTRIESDGTRKRIAPQRIPQHHTILNYLRPNSKEPQTYDLEFEGLSMRLVARKSFAAGMGMSIYVVDEEHASKPNLD